MVENIVSCTNRVRTIYLGAVFWLSCDPVDSGLGLLIAVGLCEVAILLGLVDLGWNNLGL